MINSPKNIALCNEGKKRILLSILDNFNIYADLVKLKLTFFVGLSAAFGYLLNSQIDINLFYIMISVLLFSFVAAGLNQLQEIAIDKKMSRTAERPLVVGKISETSAIVFLSVIFALASLFTFNFLTKKVFIFAIITIVLYNLLYTPLKKHSDFALIPGALVGSIVPVAAYHFAGGAISDIKIISTAIFIFLWQMPHFWLLALKYKEDYKKAGLPVLNFTKYNNLVFIWILAMIVAGFFTSLHNIENSTFKYISIIIGLAFAGISIKNTFSKSGNMFLLINIYMLLIVLTITLSKF